ncbi:hypothetical protein [Cognatishimia sp. F0-27]|uniref:hypothetical protein n=1 Tax=Cognatishimia sp. F0-27 TaxID=2816855 RepID=UPI001D0CBCC6|nr:hypothetical protein [Cognatishimia sp. F0-27]MCC1491971.1 hypothetical protein [Cognatishimia sp. F0-27]
MLVVVGLIIAFVLVAVFSNRATRSCRWREYREETESRWVCIHCGVELHGPRGIAPKHCHRPKQPDA